jgi:cephalosporin hydroxylase
VIEPNIYCKVSGMVMRCISILNDEGRRLPSVIEIGCADGQGTMRYAGFCSHVIAIDAMAQGRPDLVRLTDESIDVQHVGTVSNIVQDGDKLAEFQRRTKDLPVELVIGLSTDRSTVDQVAGLLTWAPDSQVDILVIDGCHHPFEAVWADFEAYVGFVRPGGFVIFDDLYEDCIEQCRVKAIDERGFTQVSRWGVRSPTILQDAAALRKPLS